MGERKRHLCRIITGYLLFFLCVSELVIPVRASDEQGRILFISSYSYAWDSVQLQIEGIKEAVNGQAVVDYEFMDTKRVDDETSMQQFYEGLSYRMSQVEPYDVVILGDDAALLFAMEHRDDLFDGIPLVFEGINDVEYAMELAKDPLITGVVEKLSWEKNIELAQAFYPDADRVVAILDDSITGQAERKSFYATAEQYPGLEFTEINASELTSWDLTQTIKNVQEDSILIYIVMTEDAGGKRYTNAEAVHVIAKYAKVPTFRMVEGGVGEGLLGGNMVSMQKSGEIAAEIAMDIINGTPSKDIGAVSDSPNMYYIDESVMEKFGLDKSLIPEDAIIVNHQPDFWERNKEALLPVMLILIVVGLVVAWMIYDNFRRRKLMGELEEARSIMESAAQHDFLTGIPNRSKFMDDLYELIEAEIPCTIIMLDIDNFKHINDTYGHTAGDEALQQLAERMKALQTPIFTPYRLAGDEFIFLLKSSQKKIVDKSVLQCRQLFDKPFLLAGEEMVIGGSMGVAEYPSDAADAEQLFVRADAAMYAVKRHGKNNVAFADDYADEE